MYPQLQEEVAANRAIFYSYERDRRHRLTTLIAPTIGGIIALNALIFSMILGVARLNSAAIPLPAQELLASIAPITLILYIAAAMLGGATFLVRRGHVNASVGLTVAAVGVAILGAQGFWILRNGIDPYSFMLFAALLFVIVLVGVLGDAQVIALVTAGISLYTLALWLMAPRNSSIGALLSNQFFAVVSSSISIEWGVAIVLIVLQRISQRTLVDLEVLRLANERSRQVDEIKDMFITSVNHELRTPVMAVMGMLDLALAPVEMPVERRQRLVVRARDASLDLAELLQSILDIRRIDQQSDDIEPVVVFLRQTLDEAVELLDPREAQMTERELRLRMANDLAIWGEPVRLRQVLTNLLSNAVKYSPAGSPLDISAYRVMEPVEGVKRGQAPLAMRAMVECTIHDYGLGIPPQQIPLLFKRFVRLPRDLASTVIGNGLGLYLCRQLVEGMGGRIWVESNGIPGEGSTFFIRLPLATVPKPEEIAPIKEAAHAKGVHH